LLTQALVLLALLVEDVAPLGEKVTALPQLGQREEARLVRIQ
jgi:hypothetical protein